MEVSSLGPVNIYVVSITEIDRKGGGGGGGEPNMLFHCCGDMFQINLVTGAIPHTQSKHFYTIDSHRYIYFFNIKTIRFLSH